MREMFACECNKVRFLNPPPTHTHDCHQVASSKSMRNMVAKTRRESGVRVVCREVPRLPTRLRRKTVCVV
jgi:hypothetical protein